MTRCILVVWLAASAAAQPVSFGVKGGIPITDFFSTIEGQRAFSADDTPRYLVGPTVEFHGPLGLSLELDGLYRRVGYSYQAFGVDTVTDVRTHANAWQFPLLVKWAFLPGPVKPFVDGGAAVQHIFAVHQIETLTVAPSRTTTTISSTSADLANDTSVGFVFGGGVQLKLGRLRIEPEFRYVRWGSQAFRNPAQSILATNLNEGDFILGVTF